MYYKKEKKDVREEKKMTGKKCPHCGGRMRNRGVFDIVGGISWKCRNKKCGKVLRIKKGKFVPPIPLTYERKVVDDRRSNYRRN